MSVASNLLSANVSGMETDISGWTAGANTTLSWSTRFFTGSHSLGMTATASGSVTATTASRVGVTAGTIYTAYAYFALIVAASGRTANVTISWYAAATGGSAISTNSAAAVSMPSATTWPTPPPILLATAPAGAAYASMTVTVTGMTAASVVAMDVASFGPPALIVGNLLDYATQGCEVDVSGWSAVSNCTVSSASSNSFEGWRSLGVTATAVGDAQARATALRAVVPGTEYLAYGWVSAPVSGSVLVDIDWYDGSGTFLSSSSQTWNVSASTWTRCSVDATAPVGSAKATVTVRPQATTAGQLWLFDQMALLVAPVIAGNLLGYDAQSMETTISAWSAAGGCDISRSTTAAWEGMASLEMTADGTGDATVVLSAPIPVTPHTVYTVAPRLSTPLANTADTVVHLLLNWYDAAGNFLSRYVSTWTLVAGGGWYLPRGAARSPAAAATMTVGISWPGSPAGSQYFVDSVSVFLGGLGVSATPIAGAYGAEISLQGLTQGGLTYWGLWRTDPSGSLVPVRGADGDLTQVTITGDLAVAEDYEAPLGVPVTYFVKIWTSTASYQAVSSDPITLDEPPDTSIVLTDPALPARTTLAVVETVPDWTTAARQSAHAVRGRRLPIVLSDVRSGPAGTMTLVTETRDDIDGLTWLFETGNTLLIRWPDTWSEDDVYVQVGDVTPARVSPYAAQADREWSVPLTVVDRPVGGATGSAARTWETVLDDNADWLAVLSGATRWIDVYTGLTGA